MPFLPQVFFVTCRTDLHQLAHQWARVFVAAAEHMRVHSLRGLLVAFRHLLADAAGMLQRALQRVHLPPPSTASTYTPL
eukprot:COSAG01_NODE_19461_length_1008_cov_1.616062_1_plen_78_part_10